MHIQMLNEETINKIAAGEVIVRPVSVVKELVENAIDAGAARITVSVVDGGTKSITVSDNGCGIPYNEVQLAFERHATSKLRNIEGLQEVRTLGFRGEALSSIIAVSKVMITTRYCDEEIGSQTVFEGGKCINQRVCGHDRGTVMMVQDLFYNIPARQKHMGKAKTEAALVRDLMEKLALSHPEISFTYVSDEKKYFSTRGNGKLKDSIEMIYGRSLTQGLLPLETENKPMALTGYIGGLSVTKATKDLQIFFINGRYVKNPILSQAFEAAYEGYLMQHRHPVGIVFIELPGRLLDVNIHPAKTEIGILNQSLVSILFKQAIREVLQREDLSIYIEDPGTTPSTQMVDNVRASQNDNGIAAQNAEKSDIQTKAVKCEAVAEQISVYKSYPENDTSEQLNQKDNELPVPDTSMNMANAISDQQTKIPENKPKIDFTNVKIIGQLFHTYVLVEQGQEAFLIDQHAAHEAFMYEELRQRFETKSQFPSQVLLSSEPISVPRRLITDFNLYESALQQAGYECDVFGEDTLMLRSVPIILGEPQPISLIHATIEHLLYHTDESKDLEIQRIITMSCKAAVKGNQTLSQNEIRILLNKLMQLNNPFTCPHGRPIIFRIKAYELEKIFKRVV